METEQEITPATEDMLKLLLHSKDLNVANLAKRILNKESTVDEEEAKLKPTDRFIDSVLCGDVEQALRNANNDNLEALRILKGFYEKTMLVRVNHRFLLEHIGNIVDDGLMHGGYWIKKIEEVVPKPENAVRFYYSDGECAAFRKEFLYAISEGGAIIVTDKNNNTNRLDFAAVQKGMEIMSEKYYSDFHSFLEDYTIGKESDILIQCALYGEVIFEDEE
jgi:hypothetical protein